jgi:predicted Ser/Thr protein kinase
MDLKLSVLRTSCFKIKDRDRRKRGTPTKRECVHIILACFVTGKYLLRTKGILKPGAFSIEYLCEWKRSILSRYICPISSMSVLHAGHSDSPHLTHILEIRDSELF